MRNILKALSIGVVAGIIDVVPMLIQNLSWYANISAFFHWVLLGLLIPYIKWNMPKWLTGLIVSVLSALPIVVITLERDSTSVIPILISSVILGVFVGLASQKLVKE